MSDYFLNKIYDSLLSKKPVPKKPEPIVEKKEAFKPLSKVYEILVREKVDHRAIYGSEELVDPKAVPSKPGLQTLGAVSDRMYRKITQQVRAETGDLDKSIKDLFKIANLPEKVHDFVKEKMISSDLSRPEEFINLLIQKKKDGKGLFEVPTGAFNSIQLALIGLGEYFQNEKREITTFLSSLLKDKPSMAATAVGAGELFFSMVTNAQVAGGATKEEDVDESGQKSGDLQIPNLGLVEAKATGMSGGKKKKISGARLGGDGSANDSLDLIPQFLQKISSGYVERGSFEKQILEKIINYLRNIPDDKLNDPNAFVKASQDIKNYLQKAELSKIGRDINKFNSLKNAYNIPITLNSLVNFSSQTDETDKKKKESWNILKNQKNLTKGIPFIKRYLNYLQELLNYRDKEIAQAQQQGQKLQTNYLDILLYDAVNFIRKNQTPDQALNSLIEVMVLLRNQKTTESQLKQQLQSTFTRAETIYNLTKNRNECNKLIGAIHLYCYSVITKPAYYLLLNTVDGFESKNNCLIFKTPSSLQEAFEVANRPGIQFNTRVDTGKTIIAKSVNIEYYP
jgi:hypothetical protein